MTPEDLRDCLLALFQSYFKGAAVFWAENRRVKPALPFVSLRLSNLTRSGFPIVEEQDGEWIKCYPSGAMLEINLFTAGKPAPSMPGKTAVRRNTVVSDLSAFFNFLDSEYALSYLEEHNVSLSPEGAIQDVSGLLNETQYEFRAMAECSVSFVQQARGWAGIKPQAGEEWEQTGSGGGSEELARMETGWTDSVEITGKNEKGEEPQ